MQRFSANTNTKHCSKRSQILGEAAAPVPGTFFLGCRVPSEFTPTSVPPSSSNAFRRKMIFAIALPESSGFASNLPRPLHKPSLAFPKSTLPVHHSRRPEESFERFPTTSEKSLTDRSLNGDPAEKFGGLWCSQGAIRGREVCAERVALGKQVPSDRSRMNFPW